MLQSIFLQRWNVRKTLNAYLFLIYWNLSIDVLFDKGQWTRGWDQMGGFVLGILDLGVVIPHCWLIDAPTWREATGRTWHTMALGRNAPVQLQAQTTMVLQRPDMRMILLKVKNDVIPKYYNLTCCHVVIWYSFIVTYVW
jgi:hypothetical protein